MSTGDCNHNKKDKSANVFVNQRWKEDFQFANKHMSKSQRE